MADWRLLAVLRAALAITDREYRGPEGRDEAIAAIEAGNAVEWLDDYKTRHDTLLLLDSSDVDRVNGILKRTWLARRYGSQPVNGFVLIASLAAEALALGIE